MLCVKEQQQFFQFFSAVDTKLLKIPEKRKKKEEG